MTGIVGYGTYIPESRISVGEIARVWGKSGSEIKTSLGITQKSVGDADEDAVTIAITSGFRALQSSDSKPSSIEALFIGSESHPYAVNPSSTITGELLGLGNGYIAADFQFACKAGTAAMIAAYGLIESKKITKGMAIGADVAQGKPHDVLEYASAAGGAAFILGNASVAVELVDFSSFSSDTPDFWRRDGIRYPSHAGRFTGEPAYYAHVIGAAKSLMNKTGISCSDVDYCVFHMPNGKFPRDVAKQLGFENSQLAASLTVDFIGNPYSASSLLGLARILDEAKPDATIFMVSYGSGAGADALLWKTTKHLGAIQKELKKNKWTVNQQLEHTKQLEYAQYLRQTRQL